MDEVSSIMKNKTPKKTKKKFSNSKIYSKAKMDFSLDKRIMAVLTDYIILIVLIAILSSYIELTKALISPVIAVTSLIVTVLTIVLLFCFPLLRDIMGRSLGKKLFKLKIISTKGNEKPTIWQLILRNLIFLGVFDLIFILFVWTDGCRIGDKIANTRVVRDTDRGKD